MDFYVNFNGCYEDLHIWIQKHRISFTKNQIWDLSETFFLRFSSQKAKRADYLLCKTQQNIC